jgi:hypothetical protein
LLRIESLQPHFVNGLIRIHPSQTVLEEQLKHFPMAAHDDGPDALHMLWMLAVTGFSTMEFQAVPRKHQRQQQSRQSFEDDFVDNGRFGGEW